MNKRKARLGLASRVCLVGVSVVSLLLLSPVPVHANCYSGEQNQFGGDTNSSHARGSTAEIKFIVQDFENGCANNDEGARQLAHIFFPATGGFDEVGWIQYPDSGFTVINVITEGYLNGSVRCHAHTYNYETISTAWQMFRVSQVTLNGNPDYWAFKVNYEDGNGWINYDHCLGDDDHGWAEGEVVRFGGTGGSAQAVFHNLEYRNASNNWVAWSGVGCGGGNNITGWKMHLGNVQSFTMDQTSPDDCF